MSLRTEDEFTGFVGPHWSSMAKFARHVAPLDRWEDVLQEAVTTAWRKRHQYDPDRGSARNWLLAIVADRARKSYRRKTFDEHPLTELTSDPTQQVDTNRRLDLEQAIAALAPRQRQAIVLHYFVDLSRDDVANVMNCSSETVKATLAQARGHLARILGKDYHHV